MMKNTFSRKNIITLKRDLTFQFVFLLSLFLILLVTSFVISSRAIKTMEYDSILLNIAGRQRMLVRQFVSDTNQAPVELATSDFDMAHTGVEQTSKMFEKAHYAFINGGEILSSLIATNTNNKTENESHSVTPIKLQIPAETNSVIISHLDHVKESWLELKRLSLLSLRSETHNMSDNPYTNVLFKQSDKVVEELEHVITLMQINNEAKLEGLYSILLSMVALGIVIFIFIVYFVYSKIVKPLDNSIKSLHKTSQKFVLEKTRAEQANAAKSEFLTNMSHELRTPLNAVMGFGQMLELDAHDFSISQQENIQEILTAGEHLLLLINSILDLGSIETGKIDIPLTAIELDNIVTKSINLILPSLDKNNITLTDNISGNSLIILANELRLTQVLVNLLSNAVKYNSADGTIILTSKIIDKHRIRVEITDTGAGLSDEDIMKLFMPFERLENSNNVEGSGIGLALSKRLIKIMGGTIGVESSLGEGSTFWIELALIDNN